MAKKKGVEESPEEKVEESTEDTEKHEEEIEDTHSAEDSEKDETDLDDELLEGDKLSEEAEKLEQLQNEDKGISEEKKQAGVIKSSAVPKKTSTIVLTKENMAEKLSEELEKGEERKDYKHLDVKIEEIDPNDYLIHVNHQDHGFMNYFVSKVLKIKGVAFAAYKLTSLDPPNMEIKLDGTKDIKTVLKEVTKNMKIELKGMTNAVSSVKI